MNTSTLPAFLNLILLAFLVNGEGEIESVEEVKEAIVGQAAALQCNFLRDLGTVNGILIFAILPDKREVPRVAFYNEIQKYTLLKVPNLFKESSINVSQVSTKSYKFEIPNVTVEQDGLGIRCGLYTNGGMGNLFYQMTMLLKVVQPPTVTIDPSRNITRTLSDKKGIVMKCKATGRPNPTMKWTRENSKSEEDAKILADGSLELSLEPPIKVEYEGYYKCSATVNSTKLRASNKNEESKRIHVSVQYEPVLSIGKSTIFTNLNEEEKISISVKGNPTPTLDCSLLHLPQPKRVRVTPYASHHRLEYEVTLKVKESDIGNHTCTASNVKGTAKASVQLLLAPSAPLITSKNDTKYSNYYQLHWSVKSGAPMHNVTVEIRVRSKNDSKLVRTDTFKLRGDDRAFRHHIANLTGDLKHELRVKACNVRDCGPVNKIPVYFRTMKYNGTNAVDPNVLKIPVTEPPKTGEVKDPVGTAASLRPFTCSVTVVTGMLILLPML